MMQTRDLLHPFSGGMIGCKAVAEKFCSSKLVKKSVYGRALHLQNLLKNEGKHMTFHLLFFNMHYVHKSMQN